MARSTTGVRILLLQNPELIGVLALGVVALAAVIGYRQAQKEGGGFALNIKGALQGVGIVLGCMVGIAAVFMLGGLLIGVVARMFV